MYVCNPCNLLAFFCCAQAQYYDTPWLSWRNGVWRLGELHKYGYNW
jgi:hypothetical protein